MKRVFCVYLFIAMILLLPANVHASNINVLSTSYHIWGLAEYQKYGASLTSPGEYFVDSYDLWSTGAALSKSAQGWTGGVSSSVNGTIENFAASLSISGDPLPGGVPWENEQVGLSAYWTFTVSASELNVQFLQQYYDTMWWDRYWPDGLFSLSLKDTTLNTTLLSYSGVPSPERVDASIETPVIINTSGTFSTDPSHMYSLSIFGGKGTGSWLLWGQEASISSSITATPEPTTMLLLSLGLVGIAEVRRMIKK